MYVTVGVIDFAGMFKDVALSTENNHAISTCSQRKTNDKRSVTARCSVFGAMVRGPTAKGLKAVGLHSASTKF